MRLYICGYTVLLFHTVYSPYAHHVNARAHTHTCTHARMLMHTRTHTHAPTHARTHTHTHWNACIPLRYSSLRQENHSGAGLKNGWDKVPNNAAGYTHSSMYRHTYVHTVHTHTNIPITAMLTKSKYDLICKKGSYSISKFS